MVAYFVLLRLRLAAEGWQLLV